MSQNPQPGLAPVRDKGEFMQAINNMSSEDKHAMIVDSLKQLSPGDRQAIADQAGLIGSPSKTAGDTLWFIIVTSFAIVLVGTFVSLAIGVLVLGKSAANADLQILLTMFTGVVAFLAGLLTPGPTHSSQSPAQ